MLVLIVCLLAALSNAVDCSSRTTCKSCAAPDGLCLWDLKYGCLPSKDYVCLMPCVREAAQCPACSTLTSQGCGICTNKGCFWNPTGSGTCQEVKCPGCKKNGDCVPPGCTQYKTCSGCILAHDTLTPTTPCQWNPKTNLCNAGCLAQPDVPTTCIAKGDTCPALTTLKPWPHPSIVPVGTINPVVVGNLIGNMGEAHSAVPLMHLAADPTVRPSSHRQLTLIDPGVLGALTGPVSGGGCSTRNSCSACTSDGKCFWDPNQYGTSCKSVDHKEGEISLCLGTHCAHTPAQCPVCSSLTLAGCASCTERGCFWNPSTSTCVTARTSTTKQSGDCRTCASRQSCFDCVSGIVPGSTTQKHCSWDGRSCRDSCILYPGAHQSCVTSIDQCQRTT